MTQVPALYAIVSRGETIGHSELEHGDPPMGVAFGRFIPAANFDRFVRTVPPNMTDGDDLVIWNELSVESPDGSVIECLGVAVFRYDFEGEIDLRVDVLGIGYPLYEDLFPHHVDAYKRRFSDAADL